LVHLFQHLGAAAKDDHMVATLVEGCRHRTPARVGTVRRECLDQLRRDVLGGLIHEYEYAA
jgi:hypothetical protein